MLRETHTFRSWTDLRLVGHRDVASSGEEGFEIATIDATNGSTTWRVGLEYRTPARCVEDRPADDARLCEHWTGVAESFAARFEAVGPWQRGATVPCEASG